MRGWLGKEVVRMRLPVAPVEELSRLSCEGVNMQLNVKHQTLPADVLYTTVSPKTHQGGHTVQDCKDPREGLHVLVTYCS